MYFFYKPGINPIKTKYTLFKLYYVLSLSMGYRALLYSACATIAVYSYMEFCTLLIGGGEGGGGPKYFSRKIPILDLLGD